MKFVLIGAVAVGLLVYFVYAHPILKAMRVGKSLVEQAVAYEQHPADATTRILVAGDSTGVGVGAHNPAGSIAGRIGADFPKADIQNISESGIRLGALRKKLEALPDQHYDIIVLQIGANDVVGFTSRKKVAEELAAVLAYAESHASSTVLLTAGNIGLSPVFRAPLSALITSRTLMVREVFQAEAKKRTSVTYVDLFKSAEDEVFNTDIDKYYAPDLFHPSSDGYGEWYPKVVVHLR